MANIAVPRALVDDHSPESQSLVNDVDVEVRGFLYFSFWEMMGVESLCCVVVWCCVGCNASHGGEFDAAIAGSRVPRKLESGQWCCCCCFFWFCLVLRIVCMSLEGGRKLGSDLS